VSQNNHKEEAMFGLSAKKTEAAPATAAVVSTRSVPAAAFEPVPNEDARERLIHLRVKIKSLAAEAAIIRGEARRTRGLVRWGLNHHRTTVVRKAARESLLAYSMLRGVPYNAVERSCREAPDWAAVSAVARRFGGDAPIVAAWVRIAQEYRKACQQAA
jgi:hypothetical protein